MAIATATAIALAAGVGAGASVAGAKIASGAAKDAARTQSQAAERAAALQRQETERALAFQREQWEQAQANAAPYLSLGRGATGTLANLMGVEMPADGGAPPMRPAGGGQTPMAAQGRQGGMTLARMGPPQMLLLQAPTGELREVPADQAERFIARGARVLNASGYGGGAGQAVARERA